MTICLGKSGSDLHVVTVFSLYFWMADLNAESESRSLRCQIVQL